MAPPDSTRPPLRFGSFELRPAQRRLLANGRPVPLGARAFDLLLALIEWRDRVASADELFERVWPGLVVEDNNLRQQVAALRRALGPDAIATLPGRGYRFTPALQPVADGATAPAAGNSARHNLPLNLPRLIGREPELAALTAKLGDSRMLTLVGAGGVGKTRLALELAASFTANCRQGVWLVELAPVADPAHVLQAVASVLGVHEEPGRALQDTLLDALRHREVLIVLDNCEHLIEACARWCERLLRHSAGARVLATSREALGIVGEISWPVPSLRAAAPGANTSPSLLAGYAATTLFVERAAAVAPGFTLTPENSGAVARICHQLDGMPLALELAAARVKAMRVEQVADRLGDRFALLTHGSRTALPRHRTLHALIEWSHELLSEPERVLLRRLSVFAGGWTLEAAEAVCSGAGLATADVLETLTLLVEKSMVMPDDEAAEPRYHMLETIRQFGLERLGAAGEVEQIAGRHLHHLADFAEGIRTGLNRQDQLRWHAQAEVELDNIRVALQAALSYGHAGDGLRIINALHRWWYKAMLGKEVIDWQTRLAKRREQDGHPVDAALARSFYVAGMLAFNFDPPLSRSLCSQCLRQSRDLAFDEGEAWALMWLGHIETHDRDPATLERFTESMRIGRRIQDPWRQAYLLGNCLLVYAHYESQMGRNASAETKAHACEAEFAKIGGDPIYLGHCRQLLATQSRRAGRLDHAEDRYDEALALYRSVDSTFDVAVCLSQICFLALTRGDGARALRVGRESLPLLRNYPMSPLVTKGLAFVMFACAACERWPLAAQLVGTLEGDIDGAERKPGTMPKGFQGGIAKAHETAVARTRAALGEADFVTHWEAGRCLTREQAMELAVRDDTEGATPSP